MKLFFCPACGRDFESDECVNDGASRHCPVCANRRVLMKGTTFIAVGMVLAMLATQIIAPFVLTTAVAAAGGLCLSGIVRVWKHHRAIRQAEQAQSPNLVYHDEDAITNDDLAAVGDAGDDSDIDALDDLEDDDE